MFSKDDEKKVANSLKARFEVQALPQHAKVGAVNPSALLSGIDGFVQNFLPAIEAVSGSVNPTLPEIETFAAEVLHGAALRWGTKPAPTPAPAAT